MLYAKDEKGEDLSPLRRARAICPQCGGEVIAKCGSHKVWHWSHTVLDCDHWTEPESPWHKGWKEIVPRRNQEVTLGAHRADIQLDSGLVIELQNSSISGEEIEERERHYGTMVWLFNGIKFSRNCIIAECSKLHGMVKPRYRSSGTDFTIFETTCGYFRLAEFPKEQDRLIEMARSKVVNLDEVFSHRFPGVKRGEGQGELGFTSGLSAAGGMPGRELTTPFTTDNCFDHKSFAPFLGNLEAIHCPYISGEILARPVLFRWQWLKKALACCQKPVFWDVGSPDILIFFPNGIKQVVDQASMLHAQRKLKRKSDLCAWVVSRNEILEQLISS